MKSLLDEQYSALMFPETFLFCDKPLPQCGSADIQRLTRETVQAKIRSRHPETKIFLTNAIGIPDDWQLTNADHKNIKKLLEKNIPNESFVICDTPSTGLGVYACQTIPKGSIVLYAGIILPKSPQNTEYLLNLPLNPAPNSQEMIIDGMSFRNHAVLFQGLYPASQLTPETEVLDVATANFGIKFLTLGNGESIPYFEALCDIKPKQQCGIDYGHTYWSNLHMEKSIVQEFFKNDGTLIPRGIDHQLRLCLLTENQIIGILKNTPNELVYIATFNQERFDAYIPADQNFIDYARQQILISPDPQITALRKKYLSPSATAHNTPECSFSFMKNAFRKPIKTAVFNALKPNNETALVYLFNNYKLKLHSQAQTYIDENVPAATSSIKGWKL